MEGLSHANGGPVLGEGRKNDGLGSNEVVSTVHCSEEFTGKERAALLDGMKTESSPGKIHELRHNQIQSEDQTHPQNEDMVSTHLGEQTLEDIVPTHPCRQTRPQNEDMVPTHPCLEGEQTRPQNEVHHVLQSDGGSLQNDSDMATHTQERASPASSAEDKDVLFVVEHSTSGGVNGAGHVTETTNHTTEFGRAASGVGRTNGIAEVNGIGHVTEITNCTPIEAEGLYSRDEMTSADAVSHHLSGEGCASGNNSIGLVNRTQKNGTSKQDIEASGEDGDRGGGGGGGERVCSGDRVASGNGEGGEGGGGRWKDGDVQVDKDVDKSVSRDETSR